MEKAVTTLQDNPLADFTDLPRFAEIRPEHIGPALDVLLAQAQAAVDRAEDPATQGIPRPSRPARRCARSASMRATRRWRSSAAAALLQATIAAIAGADTDHGVCRRRRSARTRPAGSGPIPSQASSVAMSARSASCSPILPGSPRSARTGRRPR